MAFTVINPATGKAAREYKATSRNEAHAAIERAHEAFLKWRRESFAARAVPMRRAAQILRDRAHDYGKLMAEEMGKPIRDGILEAQKCALGCDFYAENAERFLTRQMVEQGAKTSFVVFQPIGVVLAVMPWNFPFWQVFRFAAPALMAGNAGVLKHASNVPGSALAIAGILREAGFPQGLFETVLVGSRDVDDLIAHPKVRAVTLTGSTPAGRAVAAKAGSVLKKTVLELGGSDPYLILDDVDVEFAAAASAKGRLVNSGQSCIAAKRFIVLSPLLRRFEESLVRHMQAAKVGDPMDAATEIGPLAREDLRDDLHRQVEDSIRLGARRLCGGEIPNGPGAFYPPTVLSSVTKGMPAYDEEMFGPVAAVIEAKNVSEAVRIANDSEFGLGGGVFTRDLELGERLAVEEIESGLVFVNGTVVSDPRLPFGGVKDSGYGRELASFGIQEFVNIKTVVVAPHGVAAPPQKGSSE
jgi:succinate-semialdehyde dehydrogenase/glutarate-semialdehyde dehydrogenase